VKSSDALSYSSNTYCAVMCQPSADTVIFYGKHHLLPKVRVVVDTLVLDDL